MIWFLALGLGAISVGAGLYGALAAAAAKKKANEMAYTMAQAREALATSLAGVDAVLSEVSAAIRAYPTNVEAVYQRGVTEGGRSSAERVAQLEAEAADVAVELIDAADKITESRRQFSSAAAILAGLGDEKAATSN